VQQLGLGQVLACWLCALLMFTVRRCGHQLDGVRIAVRDSGSCFLWEMQE